MISKLSESAFSTTTGIVMPASRSVTPSSANATARKLTPWCWSMLATS